MLELGCGDGANLLALAFYAPGCRFVGLDGSESHIAQARRVAAEIGVHNVSFVAADLRDPAQEQLGAEPFDYVLCHGVLSWVPADAQRAIFERCRTSLAPDGLACISYNALPGWRVRGLVREVLMRAVDPDAPPLERARQAKAHAAAVITLSTEAHPYGLLLAREMRLVTQCRDAYLVHEYLAPHNEAFWLRDLIDRVRGHGLAYVAESSFNRPDGQPVPTTIEALGSLGLASLALEETLDVLLYRQFRSSVLCRESAARHASHGRDMLERAEVALVLEARGDPFRLADGALETFHGQHGFQLDASDAALKAALVLLSSRWPAGLDLAALRAEVEQLLVGHGLPPPRLDDLDDLGACALELYRAGQADVRLTPMGPSQVPEERPRAHALARHEARTGKWLTSKPHVTLPLDAVARSAVLAFDGSRTLDEVVDAVAREHESTPHDALAGQVRSTLQMLARWHCLEG